MGHTPDSPRSPADEFWSAFQRVTDRFAALRRVHTSGFALATRDGTATYQEELAELQSSGPSHLRHVIRSLRRVFRDRLPCTRLAEADRDVDAAEEVLGLLFRTWVPSPHCIGFDQRDADRPVWCIGPDHDERHREFDAIAAEAERRLERLRRWAAAVPEEAGPDAKATSGGAFHSEDSHPGRPAVTPVAGTAEVAKDEAADRAQPASPDRTPGGQDQAPAGPLDLLNVHRSAAELAQDLGQPVARVETFLRRYREDHPDCCIDVTVADPGARRRNEVRYLYRVKDVLPALRERATKWAKMTDDRRTDKNPA